MRVTGSKYQVLNTADKRRIKGSTLIRIPADDDFFTTAKANTTKRRKPTIIISGRLTKQKGTDMLPELFQQLKRKKILDSFKFLISGSGDLEDLVHDLAKRYKNIHYSKSVPHEKMPAFLAKGNIFLMLSRYEGSPTILAEAMAMGLVIVSFKISGIYTKKTKDIIYFAEPNDTKQIRDILMKLLRMPHAQWKEQSEKAIEYAKHNYTIDGYIKKLEALFAH